MKTHKNNFPDFQQIKTFFQSFFKKTTFVLKKIISLQVNVKNSVYYKSCLSKCEKFQKGTRISVKTLAKMRANLFVPMVSSHNLERRIM